MVDYIALDPNSPGLPPGMEAFYDISHAVGVPLAPGDAGTPPNHRHDVLLIQYMLDKAYEGESLRPMGRMLIDGKFGPITHYWMLFFLVELESQDETTKFGERANFISFRSHFDKRFSGTFHLSLIGQLNMRIAGKSPIPIHQLAEKDPKFPKEVSQELIRRAKSRLKAQQKG
ncbi:MAG TPA: hypothetical protein VJ890_17010 [Vineibacter sp.]|nr:hypothetical protein [Vineibacter sp.]